MDLLTITSKDEQANGMAPKSGGMLQMANIAATFSEIMKRSGSMQQSDAGSFAEQAELVTPSQRPDAPVSAKGDAYDRRSDAAKDSPEQVSQGQNNHDDTAPHRAEADDGQQQDGNAGSDDSAHPDDGEPMRQEADTADDRRPPENDSGHDEPSPQANNGKAQRDDKSDRQAQGQDVAVQATAAAAIPDQVAAALNLVVADGPRVETAEQATAVIAAAEAGTIQKAIKAGEHGQEAKAKAAAAVTPQTAPTTDDGQPEGGAMTDKTAQQSAALIRAMGGERAITTDAPLADDAPIVRDRPAATSAPATPAATADSGRPGQSSPTTAAVNQMTVQGLQQAAAQVQAAQQIASNQQAAAGEAKAAIQSLQNAGPTSNHAATGEAGVPGQSAATGETAPAQRSTAAQAPQAPRFVPPGPAFSEQITVQISKAAAEGLDRINIQLRPAELGRIEVQLNVNADGQVSATITADSRTTLEMLQRDAKGMEQALQNAGLDINSGDLTFNLRERQDQGQPESNSRVAATPPEAPAVEEPPLEVLLDPSYRNQGVRAHGRINILT